MNSATQKSRAKPRGPIRRFRNLVLRGLIAILGYAVLHCLVVAFPQVVFSDHLTYRNFTVYMREEIPPEITRVLDRVASLISASELNDDDLHHEIYIFNNYRLLRFLMLRNVHFGANLATGDTFIANGDVREDVARCERLGSNDRRRRTLSESIAHEITHALIRHRHGFFGDRRLPVWLKEGYCEVIADGSAVDRKDGLSRLKSHTCSFVPGLMNLKFRLMVEYLLDVKGMTFEEIARQPPDAVQVEAEAIAALRENESSFLQKLGWKVGTSQSRASE